MYEFTIQVLHQFLHLTAQVVPMETVTEWMNRQLKDVKAVIITGVGVIALGGAGYRMVKAHFSLGSMITAGLMVAVCLWLIGGDGAQTISDLLGTQAEVKD